MSDVLWLLALGVLVVGTLLVIDAVHARCYRVPLVAAELLSRKFWAESRAYWAELKDDWAAQGRAEKAFQKQKSVGGPGH